MANYPFQVASSNKDIFRMIESTLLGKGGRRSDHQQNVFLDILREFMQKPMLAIKELKIALGASEIRGDVFLDINNSTAQTIRYTILKMQDFGLCTKPQHGVYAFNFELWEEFLAHKQKEIHTLNLINKSRK